MRITVDLNKSRERVGEGKRFVYVVMFLFVEWLLGEFNRKSSYFWGVGFGEGKGKRGGRRFYIRFLVS